MPSAAVGDSILFHRIMVFFAVYLCIISVVNLANSGAIGPDEIASAMGSGVPGDVGSPWGSVGGASGGRYIEGANTANGTVSSGVDFTTASSVNQNITTTLGGTWTLENGVGLVLTSLPWFPGDLNPSVVIARNVRSSGGIYTVNVLVDNAAGGSFYVFPRYISGYSGSDLKVVFASDGVHIRKFPLTFGILSAGDDYFYPMANAQATPSGGSTITTQLTETVSSTTSNVPDSTSILTVSKDGSTLFTTNVRSILPGNNINDMVRHGGAGSDNVNFVVKGFPDTPMLDTLETIISGSVQYSPGSVDPFAAIAGFLSLIGVAMGFVGDPLLPAWFNMIVIGSCSATLGYLYLKMIRGN